MFDRIKQITYNYECATMKCAMRALRLTPTGKFYPSIGFRQKLIIGMELFTKRYFFMVRLGQWGMKSCVERLIKSGDTRYMQKKM